MSMVMDQWMFDRAQAGLRLLLAAPPEMAAAEALAVAAGWPDFGDLLGSSVFTRVSLLLPPVEIPGQTVVLALGDAAPSTRPQARVLHGAVAVPAAQGGELNRLVTQTLGHPIPAAALRLKLNEDGVQPVDGLDRWASDAELLDNLAPGERLAIINLRTAGALISVDISVFAADATQTMARRSRYLT
jgi:hypothetical protein